MLPFDQVRVPDKGAVPMRRVTNITQNDDVSRYDKSQPADLVFTYLLLYSVYPQHHTTLSKRHIFTTV